MTSYTAAGKLLLFGEYLVLRGAKSLAIPLRFGQQMSVTPTSDPSLFASQLGKKPQESADGSKPLLHWEATDRQGNWFWCWLDPSLEILDTNLTNVAHHLQNLFKTIRDRKPELNLQQGFQISADFDRSWGLGSSSTLVSLLGQWSGVNPYILLESSFGGSGYDVACATANAPITYQLMPSGRKIETVRLGKQITDRLLFVYLGQKQDSAREVAAFQDKAISQRQIDQMSEIVLEVLQTNRIEEFETRMRESESLLSEILDRPSLKQCLFDDYDYEVKSLGAWGGDFLMATYRDLRDAVGYFEDLGYSTYFTFQEIAK